MACFHLQMSEVTFEVIIHIAGIKTEDAIRWRKAVLQPDHKMNLELIVT